MILRIAVIVLAIAAVWVVWSWNARRRLLRDIRARWGHPRTRQRDMEAIADLFRQRGADANTLDDRTWNDLLLDHVFAHLDRTESAVGQQILYDRMRSTAPELEEFEALVCRMGDVALERETAQLALSRLQDSSGYYLHRLTQLGALEERWWNVIFPIWGGMIFLALAFAILWPPLLLIVILAFPINLGIRATTARRMSWDAAWFRQVGPLLSVARAIRHLRPSLKPELHKLRRLGAIARWVSRDPYATNDFVFAAQEYLNILFLMDANALYFGARELRLRGENLRRVIEGVGEIDAAIAVASLRAGLGKWTRPLFVAPDASLRFTNIRHPLIDNAVPNSLHLAPPHGLLVTGSNMSGKSTLLRTVGLNIVLAQTIHTCCADAYEAPVYQVRSCIGRSDDLLAGKSYYMVEVESVLALVRASERPAPHFFIFDELFRGTNAVERIAAAQAVLSALIGEGKPHVTLVATHDGELVELLRESYDVCHFLDEIGPDGLIFNYHLAPGPATSRNAIALLKLSGAPESLVTMALARAADLDRQRHMS